MSISELIDERELKSCVALINKHKISSPPEVLLALKAEVASKNPSTQIIIELINKDIGLTSSILELLNSQKFNLSGEIVSIEHAIGLLGVKKLESAIIQPAYKLALTQNLVGFEDISDHSHYVGLIAQLIAEHVAFDKAWDPNAFYLAGLFHDVGVLTLSSEYPDYMNFYHENEFRPISMLAMEKGKYRVGHASIGVLLAKKWGLPNEICNAIYLHHHVYGIYKNKVSHETLAIAEILKLAHVLNAMHESDENNQEQFLMYTNSVQELFLNNEQINQIKEDIHSL